MFKWKEESLGADAAIGLPQDKGGDPPSWQGIKKCFYYGKLDHIAHFCYKSKNMKWMNAKNAKDVDYNTFVCNMEHILKLCANGSWISKQQNT